MNNQINNLRIYFEKTMFLTKCDFLGPLNSLTFVI